MINSMIPYKEGIFNKIYKFFKKLFRKNVEVKKEIVIPKEKNSFKERIIIQEDKERKRLLELRDKWENGEIKADDISDEEIDKIVEIYNEETKKIEEETEIIKRNISKMLKELKQETN